ncbi:MAG: hypothetical protein JNJ88_09870 [Planctomycetes bacterium]|nr:hypothetical protein [Planctomycetota bacterium]
MSKQRKKNVPNAPLNAATLRGLVERALSAQGTHFPSDLDMRLGQEFVDDAARASTPKSALRSLRKALEVDPTNTEALLGILAEAGLQGDAHIQALRGIVALAAERLGKDAFEEMKPHFWGFVETRPYMRARARLAYFLRIAGRLEEAAAEYREMLILSEDDNLDVRYELVAILLALGHLAETRSVMQRYREECDWDIVFTWCGVLERLLSSDETGAAHALTVARASSISMEAYLKGRRAVPASTPASYVVGSEEHAICYAPILLLAWRAHPDALNWLLRQADPPEMHLGEESE